MSRGGVQKGEGDGEWAGRGGDYKGGNSCCPRSKIYRWGDARPNSGCVGPFGGGETLHDTLGV